MRRLRADVIASRTRIGHCRWDNVAIGDEQNRSEEFALVLAELWGEEILDETHLYTVMVEPGELITRSEHEARFPHLSPKRRRALDEVDWAGASFAMASIRSRRGLVARLISFHHGAHTYSEIEQAELRTVAELTSLALS